MLHHTNKNIDGPMRWILKGWVVEYTSWARKSEDKIFNRKILDDIFRVKLPIDKIYLTMQIFDTYKDVFREILSRIGQIFITWYFIQKFLF